MSPKPRWVPTEEELVETHHAMSVAFDKVESLEFYVGQVMDSPGPGETGRALSDTEVGRLFTVLSDAKLRAEEIQEKAESSLSSLQWAARFLYIPMPEFVAGRAAWHEREAKENRAVAASVGQAVPWYDGTPLPPRAPQVPLKGAGWADQPQDK